MDRKVPARQIPEKETVEGPIQDPVFFEEAGSDIDVQSIIRIARGDGSDPAQEKPSAADAPSLQEENGLQEGKEKGPFEEAAEEAEQDGFEEDIEDADDSYTVFRPSGKARGPAPDREAYLESLPVLEKIRRRIVETRHRFGEAADGRNMRRHMMRAEKYYAALEEKALLEEEEETLFTAKEEKKQISGKQASAGSAPVGNAPEGKTPEAQKAAEPAPEARRTDEAPVPVTEASVTPAAELTAPEAKKTAVQTQAAQAQTPQARTAEAKAADARAADVETAEAKAAETKAADTKPADEKTAGTKPVETKPGEITPAGIRPVEETSPETQKAPEQPAGTHVPGTETLQERIGKAKAAGETERERMYRREEELYLARERRLEEMRRVRRARQEAQDGADIFLGHYGLTKETTVRIATLFLIAILSVVYVTGRDNSSAPDTAAQEMDGTSADGEMTSEETPEESSGESEIPTGGGDFQNSP